MQLTRTMLPMNLKRHMPWVSSALAFGAVVLPFLVYFTGVLTIGPYSGGGAGRFFVNYWGDLLRLRGAAWLLLLGPAILVVLWRILVAYASHETSVDDRPASA
jgi:hypothetical protein